MINANNLSSTSILYVFLNIQGIFSLNRFSSTHSESQKTLQRASARKWQPGAGPGDPAPVQLSSCPHHMRVICVSLISLGFSLLVLKNAEMGPNKSYNLSTSIFPCTVSMKICPNRISTVCSQWKGNIFLVCIDCKISCIVSQQVKQTFTI